MTPTRTVLVVDDEIGMRETVAEILEGAGYEVSTASNGDDALLRMRHQAFDVVVMDIRMPGRDGVSVLQEIGGPPPPVVMMTAYAVEDKLRAAMDARSFAVVHKPIPASYLIDLVARASAA
ncbi:MAG TPA: response regulator [Acidimicrobiia bacterium]|nr:response regulator [Acidimicrobiia bacterium]